MIVKLLSKHHFKCLSLKEDCGGSSESRQVKMPHCWEISCTGSNDFVPCEDTDQREQLLSLIRVFIICSRGGKDKIVLHAISKDFD